MAILCLKSSILYLYSRIFFVNRAFTMTLIGVGLLVATYCGLTAVGSLIQCLPINSNWDPTVKRKCILSNSGAIFFGALNVLTDFIIIALPIPSLWKLQMPTREKLQIMAMFMLGGLLVAASDSCPVQGEANLVYSVTFAGIYRCALIHKLNHYDASCKFSFRLLYPLKSFSLISCLQRGRRQASDVDICRARHGLCQRLSPDSTSADHPSGFDSQIKISTRKPAW